MNEIEPKKLMISRINKKALILSFLVIFIFSYIPYAAFISDNSLISWKDVVFPQNMEDFKAFFYTWNQYDKMPVSYLSQLPFYSIIFLIGSFNYYESIRLIFFLFPLLSMLSMFTFLLVLFKDDRILRRRKKDFMMLIIPSIIYAINPYSLLIFHNDIGYSLALISVPLILISYILFKNYVSNNSINNTKIIFLALILSIGISLLLSQPQMVFMILPFFVLGTIDLILRKDMKKYIFNILKVSIITVLLLSFYLLPTVYIFKETSKKPQGYSIDAGMLKQENEYTDIISTLRLDNWPWKDDSIFSNTNKKNDVGNKILNAWNILFPLVYIIGFLSIIYKENNLENQKFKISLFILFIIYFLMIVGSNSIFYNIYSSFVLKTGFGWTMRSLWRLDAFISLIIAILVSFTIKDIFDKNNGKNNTGINAKNNTEKNNTGKNDAKNNTGKNDAKNNTGKNESVNTYNLNKLKNLKFFIVFLIMLTMLPIVFAYFSQEQLRFKDVPSAYNEVNDIIKNERDGSYNVIILPVENVYQFSYRGTNILAIPNNYNVLSYGDYNINTMLSSFEEQVIKDDIGKDQKNQKIDDLASKYSIKYILVDKNIDDNSVRSRSQLLDQKLNTVAKRIYESNGLSLFKIEKKINKIISAYDMNNNDINDLQFEKINPTYYDIKINTTKSFVVRFAEGYDPFWKLTITNSDGEKRKIDPISLYSSLNGYIVDDSGNLDMTLKYEPQSWFDIGLIISIATLAFCISYVVSIRLINTKIMKKVKRVKKGIHRGINRVINRININRINNRNKNNYRNQKEILIENKVEVE